jgi:hypothetical protein
MKTIFFFTSLILLACSSVHASNLASMVKSMSKEEYLNIVPKGMNDAIIQSGAKLPTGAFTFLVGVQRIGDTMVIMYEIDYPQVIGEIKNALQMSEDEAVKYLNSAGFIEDMLGSNGPERESTVNYACSHPVIRESLNKGIITKFMYLFSTGTHLGDIEISLSMCH